MKKIIFGMFSVLLLFTLSFTLIAGVHATDEPHPIDKAPISEIQPPQTEPPVDNGDDYFVLALFGLILAAAR